MPDIEGQDGEHRDVSDDDREGKKRRNLALTNCLFPPLLVQDPSEAGRKTSQGSVSA
jgi:hypothetical protein